MLTKNQVIWKKKRARIRRLLKTHSQAQVARIVDLSPQRIAQIAAELKKESNATDQT
jgi:hypothetical protein